VVLEIFDVALTSLLPAGVGVARDRAGGEVGTAFKQMAESKAIEEDGGRKDRHNNAKISSGPGQCSPQAGWPGSERPGRYLPNRENET
jgi:hypothetical protein